MRRRIALTLAAAAGVGMLVGSRPLLSALPETTQGALVDGAPWATRALDGGQPEQVPIPRPPAGAAAVTSDPAAAERGRALVAAYGSAVRGVPLTCHLTPQVLAAVGQVESDSGSGRSIGADHRLSPPLYGPVLDGGGRAAVADTDGGSFDGNAQWDSPMGLMQMLPATWWSIGVDGDGDGLAHPQDVYDSALAVARYLCGSGRDLSTAGGLKDGLYAYRASQAYVDAVEAWISYFTTHGLETLGGLGPSTPPQSRSPQLDEPQVVAALPGAPVVSGQPDTFLALVLPDRSGSQVPPSPSGGGGTPSVVAVEQPAPRPTHLPVPSTTVPPVPGATTTPPVTTTTPPVTTTTPPGTTTTPPVTTTTPPVTTTTPPVTTTQPPVTTTNPPVTTTDPPVTTSDPPVTTSDPPVTTSDPPVTTSDPPVTTSDPPVTTSDPPVTTSDPPVTTSDPPVTTSDPPAITSTSQPAVTTSDPSVTTTGVVGTP